MDGVSIKNVNLALEKATVEYDPSQATPVDIIQRVEKLGYGTIIMDDCKDAVDYRQKESKNKREHLYFSFFCHSRCYGRW
ncbi:cation transporter [Peribacillus sp. NPDC058075]|uniref:cation transporter n=1 Tax=unclassified Peribacillus TaxID=2675266 RepID=UPI0036D7D019